MEKAAIYCFAELERAKGGGLILKKPEEKIAFLTKFFYPFWLFPWDELNLVFDGLKTTAYTLTYKSVPDTKTFLENAQRSSKSMETYMIFLSDNVNYFQTPSEEKTMVIDALITEPPFLNELNQYVSEAKQADTSVSENAFLSSAIDESLISSIIHELENLKSSFKADIDTLHESIKFLNKATRNFVKALHSSIKAVKEEFDLEIRKQEEIVAQKVNRINEEYDQQTLKMMKNFEKQLLPLQKEKVKLEKTKEQTLKKIERCDMEARTCAVNKDSVGEKKWKEKANETKKELSEIERQIEETEDKIKEIEENKSAETFKLRSEWENKIKEARKDLLELESSRDAKIQIHQQGIERLEGLTANIIQQINNITKLKEEDLANLEKLGIQQKQANPNLIYIPLYFVCYQAEMKKRYVVFPPMVANSIGFSAKIRSALGKAKVKQLLAPRFKAVTSLLEKLPMLIEKDAAFAREVHEIGERADMLKASSTRKSIIKGLEKLREEGWLSEKEHEALSQKLA
jgi:DNA repair exonuclease SbcCD ATPase subunit